MVCVCEVNDMLEGHVVWPAIVPQLSCSLCLPLPRSLQMNSSPFLDSPSASLVICKQSSPHFPQTAHSPTKRDLRNKIRGESTEGTEMLD